MKPIKNKTIRFKSIPEYWNKEKLGLKSNTVRKRDPEEPDDERFELLDEWINRPLNEINIEIENTETGKTFSRNVSDVTLWEGMYIISW